MRGPDQILSDLVMAAGVPAGKFWIDYNFTEPATATIRYDSSVTQSQINAGNAVLASFDYSSSGHDARVVLILRTLAMQVINGDKTPQARLLKATAILMKQRINAIHAWETSLKSAAAGAGTYAAFRTAIASLPNAPQFNNQDIINALDSVLGSGEADTS